MEPRKGQILFSLLLLIILTTGYSECSAAVEDLQVTQIAIQGDCLILFVFNPSSDIVSAKYSATAVLADGSEETQFSDGFIINPGQTLQVTIQFSDIIICAGGDGNMPWPWQILLSFIFP